MFLHSTISKLQLLAKLWAFAVHTLFWVTWIVIGSLESCISPCAQHRHCVKNITAGRNDCVFYKMVHLGIVNGSLCLYRNLYTVLTGANDLTELVLKRQLHNISNKKPKRIDERQRRQSMRFYNHLGWNFFFSFLVNKTLYQIQSNGSRLMQYVLKEVQHKKMADCLVPVLSFFPWLEEEHLYFLSSNISFSGSPLCIPLLFYVGQNPTTPTSQHMLKTPNWNVWKTRGLFIIKGVLIKKRVVHVHEQSLCR